MTQPSNLTPAASAQPDGHLGELAVAAAILILLAHATAGEALEHQAAGAAAGPVRTAAQVLMQASARVWVTRYGSLDTHIDPGQWADLRPRIVRDLRAARPPDPTQVALAHAREALALGTRQAAVALNIPTPAVKPLSAAVVALAKDTNHAVHARYATAERLLEASPVETHADLMTTLAPTSAAASDVERDTRTLVNTAINDGAQHVAEENGADLLWFAERDACLTCIALHGMVVSHDEDFPLKATYGTTVTEWWTPPGVTLLRPPRHPRCRCRCEPYLGHDGPGPSLPETLRREAQRSILKGWSVPSESEQVRLNAAERLLERGTTLPKSVQAAAREAVRRRKFVSREVPHGSGR